APRLVDAEVGVRVAACEGHLSGERCEAPPRDLADGRQHRARGVDRSGDLGRATEAQSLADGWNGGEHRVEEPQAYPLPPCVQLEPRLTVVAEPIGRAAQLAMYERTVVRIDGCSDGRLEVGPRDPLIQL